MRGKTSAMTEHKLASDYKKVRFIVYVIHCVVVVSITHFMDVKLILPKEQEEERTSITGDFWASMWCQEA